MSTTAVEKIKKLEAEANELRGQAKKEALAAVKAALADLNSLGFRYRLVEGGGDVPTPAKRGPKKGGKGITRKRDPNAPCSVCNFVTEPPHDARRHRAQGKSKKALTAKELEDMGYRKKG